MPNFFDSPGAYGVAGALKGIQQGLVQGAQIRQQREQASLQAQQAKEQADYRKALMEQTAQKNKVKDQLGDFNSEMRLRKQYDDLAKDFGDQAQSYERMKTLGADPTGINDVALIFAYMKLLDPRSVVREGEFETARKTGGITDTVWAQFQKVKDGRILSDDVRANMLRSSGAMFDSVLEENKRTREFYKNLAEQAGLDPARVLTPFTNPDYYTPEGRKSILGGDIKTKKKHTAEFLGVE